MPEMTAEDINDLDEVVAELELQASSKTPAEAVREMKAEIERLRKTQYPAELTSTLREVLGLMIMQTCPIAHGFRAAGFDIPCKTEEEQAFVLHWMLQIALQHGENWRRVAGERMKEIYDQAQARATTQGGPTHA